MASRGAYGKGYSRGYDAGKSQTPKGDSVFSTIVCSVITAVFGFWLGGFSKK
jgi:hypothetical protein